MFPFVIKKEHKKCVTMISYETISLPALLNI